MNLYQPGEEISPHVDLPKRFGDGVTNDSLGSGYTTQFAISKPNERPLEDDPGRTSKWDGWDAYLPEPVLLPWSLIISTTLLDERKLKFLTFNLLAHGPLCLRAFQARTDIPLTIVRLKIDPQNMLPVKFVLQRMQQDTHPDPRQSARAAHLVHKVHITLQRACELSLSPTCQSPVSLVMGETSSLPSTTQEMPSFDFESRVSS